MAPQQARADSVEGPHPETGRLGPEQTANALPHFAGSLVGERDREDPPGRNAVLSDQVADSSGQHTSFPGAGARQHQQRSLKVLDRLPLLGIERGQVAAVGGVVQGIVGRN